MLPMKGTTQDRPQGLRAQHLVPWGQFWSVTQAWTQDSSEEEELSSGHTAACPARGRRQVGRVRPPQPPPGLLGGKGGKDRKPGESRPRHRDIRFGKEKASGSSGSAAGVRELGLGRRRADRLPTPN